MKVWFRWCPLPVWVDFQVPSAKIFQGVHSLKLTFSPLKLGHLKRKRESIPTIHFQVLLLLVSGMATSTIDPTPVELKTTWSGQFVSLNADQRGDHHLPDDGFGYDGSSKRWINGEHQPFKVDKDLLSKWDSWKVSPSSQIPLHKIFSVFVLVASPKKIWWWDVAIVW